MAFQTWNHGKRKKKESNSIVSLLCQLLDQSLLLNANIVFNEKQIVKYAPNQIDMFRRGLDRVHRG